MLVVPPLEVEHLAGVRAGGGGGGQGGARGGHRAHAGLGGAGLSGAAAPDEFLMPVGSGDRDRRAAAARCAELRRHTATSATEPRHSGAGRGWRGTRDTWARGDTRPRLRVPAAVVLLASAAAALSPSAPCTGGCRLVCLDDWGHLSSDGVSSVS